MAAPPRAVNTSNRIYTPFIHGETETFPEKQFTIGRGGYSYRQRCSIGHYTPMETSRAPHRRAVLLGPAHKPQVRSGEAARHGYRRSSAGTERNSERILGATGERSDFRGKISEKNRESPAKGNVSLDSPRACPRSWRDEDRSKAAIRVETDRRYLPRSYRAISISRRVEQDTLAVGGGSR